MKPEDAEALRGLWAAAEAAQLPFRVHQSNLELAKRIEKRLETLAKLEAVENKSNDNIP
jgi:hypothetical protein